MAERKRLGADPEASAQYLGLARGLLDQLLLSMRMNSLQVLSRTVDLPNGVRITVSSVFGQHDIRIEAPENAGPGLIDAVQGIADVAEHMNLLGRLLDVVQVAGVIKVTATVRTPPPYVPPYVPPPPPPPPPPDPTPPGDPGGSGDPGGGTTPVSSEVNEAIADRVLMANSITVTIVVRTPGVYAPGAATPQVFIGGQTSSGLTAFVWDDVNGYNTIDIGGSYLAPRKAGIISGLSPNGKVLCGSLMIFDQTPEIGFGSISTGGAAGVVGWVSIAAKWQSRTDTAQLAHYISGGNYGIDARTVTNDGGTVTGTLSQTGGGFTWNGSNNSNVTPIKAVPARMGLTSPDGRVVVSGKNYKIDNGPWKPWVSSAAGVARQAPSDALAYCVVHVSATSTAPPPPDTYKTTTLVFSG